MLRKENPWRRQYRNVLWDEKVFLHIVAGWAIALFAFHKTKSIKRKKVTSVGFEPTPEDNGLNVAP